MATLRELAEITGYSIATISRVLNKDTTLKVTDDTGNAVLEAVELTGYGNRQNAHRKIVPKEHLEVGIVEKVSATEAERNPYYLYLKSSLEKGVDRPTAFFTYNDPTAIGVFRALQIMGYRVPEDFSILSYNDTAIVDVMKPQLSSICINIEEEEI